VGIYLEKPLLATPEFHDFGSSPARATTLAPIDVENLEPGVASKGQGGGLVAMLPANAETQEKGLVSLGDQVFNCRDQLKIAIRSNGDEDLIVIQLQLSYSSRRSHQQPRFFAWNSGEVDADVTEMRSF
jgi:hypothetical protein